MRWSISYRRKPNCCCWFAKFPKNFFQTLFEFLKCLWTSDKKGEVLKFFNLSVCFDCRQVSSNDYSSLDTLTKNIVKEKQPFIRLEMSKEDLLEMFKVLLTVFFITVRLTELEDSLNAGFILKTLENLWISGVQFQDLESTWNGFSVLESLCFFIEQDQKVLSVFNLGGDLVFYITTWLHTHPRLNLIFIKILICYFYSTMNSSVGF